MSSAAVAGGLGTQPRVAETLGGSGPLLRDELQHGQQEGGEARGLLLRPLVLLHQDLQETPGLQLGDVLQVACGKTAQAHSPLASACSGLCYNQPSLLLQLNSPANAASK